MPLVRGGYNVTNPINALLGNTKQVVNTNVPARSNIYWTGISTPTDNAIGATGVGTFVAIPVEQNDLLSKITILIGATGASTPTHAFGALYSGIATPALLGQSTDSTTAAIAASAAFSFTLSSAVAITPAIAPQGFIYALFSVTSSTQPTAVGCASATAVTYKWFTNGPAFLAGTAGSSLAGTAAATIASGTALATTPICVVT